ncbi:MAG: ABC transporter substrate-binding protein [Xanthobacteraceae bacterium]
MRRRQFLRLAVVACAWPFDVAAQQRNPVIGILAAPAAEPLREQMSAFRRGLQVTGFVEGQNVAVEYRWAEGHYERLPQMARDLIASGPSVIVALAPAAAAAAKAATDNIPIVFVIGADPVELGLVQSLNEPGGPVTGVNFLINALGGKRLQLIGELLPKATAFGLLVNPNAPGVNLELREAEKVADALGQKLTVLEAASERDFESVFRRMAVQMPTGLIVSPDALFTSGRNELVALAARFRVPTIYHLREAVAAGGLMSYGTSITEAHRIAGTYAGRILKGESPKTLPVQQSTNFELVINLRTATALDLVLPERLLALADEVIE